MSEHDRTEKLFEAVERLEKKVDQFEQRLVVLEQDLPEDSPEQAAEQASQPQPQVPPPPPPPAPPLPAKPKREPSALNLAVKSFFTSGNLLNKIGALSFFLAAVLFFKLAVDRNWIGPGLRVLLGVLTGLGMLGIGAHSHKKGWRHTTSGFTGAGQGILFASVYAAQHLYELIPSWMAFGLNVLITAVIFAQALRYNEQAIAVMGLLGGFLTPFLASTGSQNYFALSIYLLVLNTAVLAISYYRSWGALKWLAFTCTQLYLISWASLVEGKRDYRTYHFSIALKWILPFLAIFFGYFAIIPTWRGIANKLKFTLADIYLTVANGLVGFGIAYILLASQHRPYLGLVSALVAAVYFVLCNGVLRNKDCDQLMYKTLLGVGAWYLFAAVPMMVSGNWITIAWSVEAVFVAWLCGKDQFRFLFVHVVAILLFVGSRLLFWDELLLTPRFVDGQTYFPFSDMTTIAAIIAVVSTYVVLRLTKGFTLWTISSDWLWVIIVPAMLALFHREAYTVSHLAIAHEMPRRMKALATFSIWIGLSGLALKFVLSQLTDKTMRWLCGGVGGFLTLAAILVLWSPVRPPGDVLLGRVAFIEHLSVLMLIPLIILGISIYKALTKDARTEGQIPDLISTAGIVLLLILGIVLVIVRRELHAAVYLPPLADAIADMSKRSVYQVSVSSAYSLIALILFLRGVSKQQEVVVYASYVLFILTGIKVYLYDLSHASQMLRILSLVAFGSVTLGADFLRQRIIDTHQPDELDASS